MQYTTCINYVKM